MIYRMVFLAFGCALFVYLLVRLDTTQVLALLLQIGWNLVWIAAAYLGHQLIRTAALWLCVAVHDRMRYWDLAKIRFSGEAVQYLTFTGPFLAEPAKALLMKKRGLPATRAFAATISEYLIYTITSAMMAVAALVYMLQNYDLPAAFATGARIAAYAAAGFLATAAFAIVFRVYLIGAIVRGIRALPGAGKRVRVDLTALRATEDLLFVILRERPGRFLSILIIEFLGQAPLLLELYLLLVAAGQTFSAVDPLLIESSTKFLSIAFFFVPGRIGAAEGLYALVFAAIGLSATAGFSLALARRMRSLLVAGIGLAFLSIQQRDTSH